MHISNGRIVRQIYVFTHTNDKIIRNLINYFIKSNVFSFHSWIRFRDYLRELHCIASERQNEYKRVAKWGEADTREEKTSDT